MTDEAIALWNEVYPRFDPDTDRLPDLVRDHHPNIDAELDDLRREIVSERAYVREVSSVYWSGRY